jgi:hypothetical protein
MQYGIHQGAMFLAYSLTWHIEDAQGRLRGCNPGVHARLEAEHVESPSLLQAFARPGSGAKVSEESSDHAPPIAAAATRVP